MNCGGYQSVLHILSTQDQVDGRRGVGRRS
jgi:hypothetical protein